MIRHIGKCIVVRYDGLETRVEIERGGEHNGLTLEELGDLIVVLSKAQLQRVEYMVEQSVGKR